MTRMDSHLTFGSMPPRYAKTSWRTVCTPGCLCFKQCVLTWHKHRHKHFFVLLVFVLMSLWKPSFTYFIRTNKRDIWMVENFEPQKSRPQEPKRFKLAPLPLSLGIKAAQPYLANPPPSEKKIKHLFTMWIRLNFYIIQSKWWLISGTAIVTSRLSLHLVCFRKIVSIQL